MSDYKSESFRAGLHKDILITHSVSLSFTIKQGQIEGLADYVKTIQSTPKQCCSSFDCFY